GLAINHVHRPPAMSLSPLSLHDALPISTRVTHTPHGSTVNILYERKPGARYIVWLAPLTTDSEFHTCTTTLPPLQASGATLIWPDRKSTRLNSSHVATSYAVFCLKKKHH